MSKLLKERIIEQVEKMPADKQRKVLDFARLINQERPVGTPGKELRPFAGTLTREEAEEMMKAIEEECERIDAEGW